MPGTVAAWAPLLRAWTGLTACQKPFALCLSTCTADSPSRGMTRSLSLPGRSWVFCVRAAAVGFPWKSTMAGTSSVFASPYPSRTIRLTLNSSRSTVPEATAAVVSSG